MLDDKCNGTNMPNGSLLFYDVFYVVPNAGSPSTANFVLGGVKFVKGGLS